MLKTLSDYEAEHYRTTTTPKPPDLTGIECPDCKKGVELHWLEKSLICKNPPMRRVHCVECDFTQMIPFPE